MIAQIEGTVLNIEEKAAVISLGGLGLRVFCLPETLATLQSAKDLGEPARLFTYLVVREDALDLYGFLTTDERALFELIISISGIGPKKALAVLSAAPATTLKRAVLSNDASYLTKVSGIGKKIADKIVLELKDKITSLGGDLADSPLMNEDRDALSALIALGYAHTEAREALQKVPADVTGLNKRIKEALKQIGK
ncbi:MAG: Holliday junction branch migration protein RuvA [Candidatus Paceibacterota bacterium]|jgi:Holliday junction DNA helicase RuvA